MAALSKADEKKLVGVNERLVALVRRVALTSPMPFMVVEGLRTKQRQRKLFAEGKTKTLNSKHLIGRAVDLAPIVQGKVSWEWKHFKPLIDCVKAEAARMNIPVTCGYDWGWDAPHVELKDG